MSQFSSEKNHFTAVKYYSTAAFPYYYDPAILRNKLTPLSIFRDLREREMQKSLCFTCMCSIGAITFALILQKFHLRLSYTCAHKSGAFALSFGVTLAPIYSQLILGQLLVFEPR